jgi:hypothetical protein
MKDAVERVVDAFNLRDVDLFVTCFAESIVVEDGEGNLLMNGCGEVRDSYGAMFEKSPNLHLTSSSRVRVGSYVVDEQRVTGLAAHEVHGVGIYRLDGDGLIDRMRILK